MAKFVERLLSTVNLVVFLLLICPEPASGDTFNHQKSSSAVGCPCEEFYYADIPPFHVVTCQYINSTERVTCAHNFLEGLGKDDTVFELEYIYSNIDLFPDNFFAGFSINALTFQHCNITNIPFNVINPGCANTTLLKLNDNNIASIQTGEFDCPNLQKLLLHSNNIKDIAPDVFKRLESLIVLDLQLNNLNSLPNFSGINKLEELYLSQNEIGYVSQNAFMGYGDLKLVYLNHNNISHIENGTFEPITNEHVVVLLEANPFYCDCSLQWLKDWANDRNVDEPWCAAPIQGQLRTTDFCQLSWWFLRWK